MSKGKRVSRETGNRRTTGVVYLCVCLLFFLLAACSLVEDVPPVADAGRDQSVKLGAPITLDASQSREIDGGKIVEYRWTIIGVPKGKESELNKVAATTTDAKATIQLPNDDGALGVWTLELRVTDDGGNRAANDVRVTLTK
jgi:K319-like protein